MAVELWRTYNPCTETQSYLHESNWTDHAAKRVELQGRLQDVRQTVEDPDFVLQDEAGAVYKYRKGVGVGHFRRLWLVVIEEADPEGAHYVKTAYFTRQIKEHRAICVERLSSPG